MLAIAYRPAWGGPVQDVPNFPNEKVEHLPNEIKKLFKDKNIRKGDFFGGNKPKDMKSEAPGINIDRWLQK